VVGLPALFDRLPRLRLTADPEGPALPPASAMHGLRSLSVAR